MSTDRVVILGGARTPFARANTVYRNMSAANLGGVAIREAVARTKVDPNLIDEVYLGFATFTPEGCNVGREALFDSGLPPEIPASTVNRYCASSLETASALASKITAGQIEVGVAAGAESISSMRALFSKDATDFFQGLGRSKTAGQMLGKMGGFKLKYLAPHAPGITEPTTNLSMGQSADLMARLFEITREEQDEYALNSHRKAAEGWEKGFYPTHVVPVATPEGKVVEKDTDIRPDSKMEKLSKLRPVFFKDGTITAANASPLTDGGAATVLMSEAKANELKLQPLGAIRAIETAAVDIQKEPLLIGPVYAFPRALKKAGVTLDQIDLIEIHEAFAGQVLSTFRAIESENFGKRLGLPGAIGKIDQSKVNLYGGSIPLGHPFGATGGRVILQCLHLLKEKQKKLGLISICAAGGLGMVAVLENYS